MRLGQSDLMQVNATQYDLIRPLWGEGGGGEWRVTRSLQTVTGRPLWAGRGRLGGFKGQDHPVRLVVIAHEFIAFRCELDDGLQYQFQDGIGSVRFF